ncbi:hypothetical protein NYA22BAC_00938 [Parasphingorhabdus sp. NYA22]
MLEHDFNLTVPHEDFTVIIGYDYANRHDVQDSLKKLESLRCSVSIFCAMFVSLLCAGQLRLKVEYLFAKHFFGSVRRNNDFLRLKQLSMFLCIEAGRQFETNPC